MILKRKTEPPIYVLSLEEIFYPQSTTALSWRATSFPLYIQTAFNYLPNSFLDNLIRYQNEFNVFCELQNPILPMQYLIQHTQFPYSYMVSVGIF